MGQKVLVVDDCDMIQALLEEHLSEEPVELLFVGDGPAAVSAALAEQPDLILLDVEMPGTNGFETCRRLKADPSTADIPVVFLTGASTTEERIKGLDLGAVDYITKPFDVAELRARVRAALRTRHLHQLLAKRAMIDGLTGLWNRAYFEISLNKEVSASRRTGTPLSCIMVDVDHFKSINDRYGHPFGDQTLRVVADVISTGRRPNDTVCRYGGEEFAILAAGTDTQGAATLAERVRAAVAACRLIAHGEHVPVTCSFGIAELSTATAPMLVQCADEALYRAKRAGRNRVEIADPVTRLPAAG